MINGDLALDFAWFREQIKENRKGTSVIKKAIEDCSFSIKDHYEQHHDSLEDACIGDAVGSKTLAILELLLQYEKKEAALKEYYRIRKVCRKIE